MNSYSPFSELSRVLSLFSNTFICQYLLFGTRIIQYIISGFDGDVCLSDDETEDLDFGKYPARNICPFISQTVCWI